jgi:transposase-like protein
MAREKKSLNPHLQPVQAAETTAAVAQDEGVAPKPLSPSVPVVDSDPEVALPRRRSFSAEFKRQVLDEADACTAPGESGALLRRHGLYSSHLTEWRRLREAGELSGLTPRKRGRKAAARNPLAVEVARLEQELKRQTARAERAERLVALQKKAAELFGEMLPPPSEEPAPPPTRTRRRR